MKRLDIPIPEETVRQLRVGDEVRLYGTIMTARDALEFIIAGATAVQVGTANFVNPKATTEIADGIAAFLTENQIPRISDIIGSLEV